MMRPRTLAGTGAVAALVAALAFGSLPASAQAEQADREFAAALAQLSSAQAASGQEAAAAADAASRTDVLPAPSEVADAVWQTGHTYELPLSVWMNNQVDGATVGMQKYYGTTGTLKVAADGALDFQFTILAPDKFQGLTYQDKEIEPETVDGHAVYHIPVSAEELNNETGIVTKMRIDAMGGWFTMNIRTDVGAAKDVTPAGPDTPDTPTTPDTPETPDTPTTPSTPDTPATPDTPTTPDTPSEGGTVSPDALEVGEMYEVPISIMKYADPSEPSMSAGYFAKAAVVVKQADGTFKVRITTTNTDYIEGVQYNPQDPSSPTDPKGTPATDLGAGSFELVLTKLDGQTTVAFKVAPMNHVWASALLGLDTASIKDLGQTDDGSAPDAGDGGSAGTGTNGGTSTTPTTSAKKPATTAKKPATTATKTSTKTASSKRLPQTSDPTAVGAAVSSAVLGLGSVGAGIALRLRARKSEND